MTRVLITIETGDERRQYDDPREAALAVLRLLTPNELGKLKRDAVHLVQMEKRGIAITPAEKPND